MLASASAVASFAGAAADAIGAGSGGRAFLARSGVRSKVSSNGVVMMFGDTRNAGAEEAALLAAPASSLGALPGGTHAAPTNATEASEESNSAEPRGILCLMPCCLSLPRGPVHSCVPQSPGFCVNRRATPCIPFCFAFLCLIALSSCGGRRWRLPSWRWFT